MPIRTIDRIPSDSPIAAHVDNIALFDSIAKISGVALPVKIDFILSIMCEQGSLEINYDQRTLMLTKNCILVLRPGHVMNSYKVSSDFRGHCIMVSQDYLGDTLPAMSRILPRVASIMDRPVIKLSDEEAQNQLGLYDVLRKKAYGGDSNPFRIETIGSLLRALFFETLGLYSEHASEHSSGTMRRMDAILYEFINHVERDFRGERSVSYYADKMCISAKHLSAVIREASGRTARDWIDSYVILEAKNMLRNTGMTVQEISMRMNFVNQSFFGKYFKHRVGMSPKEYRDSYESPIQ
ncbi:MAG: helix-turn-helix domain-containing protein [Muribaculum sp.]|nr:helix-turn-helix domain-containing protein [Muribaculum sp.]